MLKNNTSGGSSYVPQTTVKTKSGKTVAIPTSSISKVITPSSTGGTAPTTINSTTATSEPTANLATYPPASVYSVPTEYTANAIGDNAVYVPTSDVSQAISVGTPYAIESPTLNVSQETPSCPDGQTLVGDDCVTSESTTTVAPDWEAIGITVAIIAGILVALFVVFRK